MDHYGKWWGRLRIIGWSLAALILVLPLAASLFTDEVDWTAGDYLFAAIVLGSIGLLFELAMRRSQDDAYRWGALVALAAAFLLTWGNAAVGLVGSGANTANSLYFAVLAIALSGAWAAGFQAKGMSTAMFATAAAQALVTLFAILFQWGGGEDRVLLVLGINAIFVLLWTASALLFRQAAKGDAPGRATRIHLVLSVLVIGIGAVLLGFMMAVEGEPGAVPLFLILVGAAWSFITLRGGWAMLSRRTAGHASH